MNEGDISAQPLASRKFDIVNVMSVIFHVVDDAAFGRALDNMAAAMNPDGLLLLSDRLGRKDLREAEHVKFRSRPTYEAELGARGLQIVETVPMFALLNGGLRNMAPKRVPVLTPTARRIEYRLPGVLYHLDRMLFRRFTSNLSLMVIRRS